MIGKELLHYRIETHLGAGGMGEVYQARDTKLDRAVALKILPELFANDPERVARFEREAKLLASLNHSNIAALYGLEQSDGRHFLVMELVDGGTLSERISQGAVPVGDALRISLQILEALEAAHDKGVVHRDLKPANVKITPEGKVKVLDFGLAKALDATPSEIDRMNSPTISIMATNAGVILGTAGYMSPEQAKGRSADQRSDIFSFGCVLFEMLTGRQTFEGETVTEMIASVLKQEADLSLLPPNIHPRVVELIRRCLVKDPKRRWHAAADVRVEIETILSESNGLKGDESIASGIHRWHLALTAAITAAVVVVVMAGVMWKLKPKNGPLSVSRFAFELPEGQSITRGGRQAIVISPDGEHIVYQANRQLYLRSISELDAHPIEGTNLDAANVFFSSDGKWIGFYSVAEQKLKKIALTGGAAVSVADVSFPFGASWSDDNQIFLADPAKGIQRVSANGGMPETIIPAKSGEVMHGPQLLPDRDHLLFSVRPASAPGISVMSLWDKGQIVVQSLKTGERKTLIEGGSDARYMPTGHLVYALGTNVLAVPFDLKTFEKTGGPIPIIEGVARAQNASAAAHFSFADNGTMVYLAGTGAIGLETKVAFVTRDGKETPLSLPVGRYSEPRISPDGKQVAVVREEEVGAQFIAIYDLSQAAALRRLTFQNADRPIWTTDGQRIVFDNFGALFWQRADGSGAAEELLKRVTTGSSASAVSPDGKTLLLRNDINSGDIWSMTLEGAREARPLISAERSNEGNGYFSPDGRWIVYVSNESGIAGGQPQIYVQPYPPTGAKYQITNTGGAAPSWSPDGKQIFYMANNTGNLWSVDVRTQPSFAFGTPAELPIRNLRIRNNMIRSYDITRDGKQFLAVFAGSSTAGQAAPQIRITLNWFEDVKQRAR
jgi:serine/threonine-protein kinase